MNKFSQARWTRRQALWLLTGAMTSVGLHACTQSAKSSSPSASSLTSITFGVPDWIGVTPLYIAEKKGFFREAGLNLTVRTFSTSMDTIPAFQAGQLQGAALVTSAMIKFADQGGDYRIVLVEDTSVGADALLARNSVSSIKDFKGKRIAVQKGAVGHFFLMQVLAEAGLSDKDVTLIDLDAKTAATAYQAGDVEIAYTFAPHISEANTNQKDGRIIYDTSKMPTAIADFYTFSTSFVTENPAAVKGFVSGVLKGLDFLKTNSSEALAIAAERFKTEPKDIQTQLEGVQLPDLKTNLDMLGNPQSNLYMLNTMNSLAKFLKGQNQIKTLPNLAKTLDPQFVKTLNTSS